MKKRLISLLVALCMAVTLLPVSAITAWAEEGGSNLKPLRFRQGYPVLDDITPTTNSDGHEIYTGKDWSYDATAKVLTIAPENPTTYDLKECGNIRLDPKSILCSAIIRKNAEIVNGKFWNAENPGSSITNDGTITSGVYSMPVINHGTITGGTFKSTVTNNGTIKGGIFQKKPEGGTVASGYTLNVNFPKNGSYESFDTGISYFGNSGYVIPNSDHDTSITIYIFFRNRQAILFPIDVTFGDTNDTHCLLEDWAPNASHYDDGMGYFSVTFTAPPATAATVTLSMLTRLVIDENGYPVGTEGGTQDYSGDGWKFENGNKKLTLESGNYDFSGEGNALNPAVQLKVKSGATLTGGAFKNEPTGEGAGTFRTVTLNGTDSITAVNGLASGDWGNTLYVVKTGNNTITASKPILDINRILLENDDSLYPNPSNKKTVCINIESLNSVNALDSKAPIILNQASHGLSLIMDSDGTPVIGNAPFEPAGGFYTYYGDGWHIQKSFEGIGRLYLTGRKTDNSYNFRFTDPVKKTGQLDAVKCSIINEGSTIEDGVFNALAANVLPNSTSSTTPTIKGGTFAAGLYYNNGEITGGAFNGKNSILTQGTVLSGNYRSVTVKDGAISKVNDTPPLVPDKTGLDLVQSSAWDLYSYAGTVLTVESNVDITNINGQKIGEAFNSSYPNGKTNKKVVCFEMPDSDVELNSTKIVVPDPKPDPKPEPKPEPKPDPTPETYTLTVKGGTFTYNGGEAMTSASVPVDAEVKVTLNQSAVPEGMVFDLWAMDEASLLGNPAVAYNEESFTIPAGSVAKGSTVTVEAQYRDATIESEPSILGTAAIIGVAGAGTAVIVWQGYRIGMELYEKYFQPTPEETAAEQPAPEAPAAAAS